MGRESDNNELVERASHKNDHIFEINGSALSFETRGYVRVWEPGDVLVDVVGGARALRVAKDLYIAEVLGLFPV